MPQRSEAARDARDYRLLAMLLLIPVAVSLAAVWGLDYARVHKSLFTMSNLIGPATDSLLHGRGLTVCTELMGTPRNPICFHSGRMPMSTLVVALGIRLLGDHYLPVACFKTILFLLPLEVAIVLVWRRLPASTWRRRSILLLLLAPFALVPFLADAANILVDEAYSYSFLAAAVALLFFVRPRTATGGFGRALLFAAALDGLYLSKSSMLLAVLVLAAGFLLLERSTMSRMLVLLLVAAAPAGWAIYQHHASGRFSLGTSLDGINLHKGNNAGFLDRYPPPPGDSLDRFDPELNRGLHFDDEWSFNDYHQQAALDYMRTHPRETMQAGIRKLGVFFLSVHKIGSTASHGALRLAEIAGLVLFRLILWAAIAGSAYVLFQPARPELRAAGGVFLALVAACALPYLAGFAYTRHVSVLIYPAVLMCCRMLAEDGQGHVPGTSGQSI